MERLLESRMHRKGARLGSVGRGWCAWATKTRPLTRQGRQGNRLTLMRLREMWRGQRERSGNWRAGCLESLHVRFARCADGKGLREWYLASRLSYLGYPFEK